MNNFATGRDMKKFITAISLLLLTTGLLQGQNVTFNGSAKNVVRTGERFNLTYTVNAEGTNFRGPDIKDFSVLSGPNTSSSSSIQIINGKVARSVEYSLTYLLAATKEGTFEIPPAKITVDGTIYESNAVKIQVVKGSTQQQGQSGTSGGSQSAQASGDLKDDVFVRAVVDKTNVMQGEQVIITYKLYFRINISSQDFSKEPSFQGFWVKDLLRDKQSLVQYKETYHGQQYYVAELKKYAIYPQTSGKVVIEPVDVNVQAQVRAKSQQRSRDPFLNNFFNDPFFNRYQTVEVSLKTNTVTLNVTPLPTNNRPADFNGAVGNFDFNSSIDKTSLKANEPLNLKFTINGTGNIELIDKVNVKFPPDFEVYDPKISKNINIGSNGVSGSKSFEYLIIPRTPGTFTINPVKFSYFDLSKKAYVTLTSPAYTINVAKGEGNASNVTYSGVNQSDIKYVGTDIHHIFTRIPEFKIIGTFFFGSTLFYILLIAPVLLFILFTIIWKNELKKRSNIALMRNRKATKMARKRMKEAQIFLKENKKEEFYEEVSRALWGYLSDKFSIALASLSMETVRDTLLKKELKEEIIEKFIDILNNCEYARFAPAESTSSRESIYNDGVNIISTIENELK